MILYEINRLFLRDVSLKFSGDQEKIIAMSLIQEQPAREVRMAYLSIVGSHSINGVAELHRKLLKKDLLSDFAALYPERFNNKTNGVTPRRWLLQCNPRLAELISNKIGKDWITNLSELTKVESYIKNKAFRKSFTEIKSENKRILANLIEEQTCIVVDSDSIFDVHIKRIHEYKRQLMNILHTIILYRRLKSGALKDFHPMTVIFGGKAAPGYFMAKLVIKLINSVAEFINVDPDTKDKLKVVFVPNYRISVAEKMFPATDLSEQISTAGFEASGTGNMKFALNGALTIGTMDGANVEMAEEIGEEHMFIFGLRVNEIEEMRKAESYNAWDVYNENKEIRETLDMVRSGFFSPKDPDLFEPIIHSLLNQGDRFFVLADLEEYDRARLQANELYKDRKTWTDKAIVNMTRIGKFSSDRTIHEYAKQIWDIKSVPAKKG